MTVHHIETYRDHTEKHFWRITDDEGELIADSLKGHETRTESLKSLFSLFFGDYDESFLTLYAEWNPQDGLIPAPEPEPVHIYRKEDAPDPEQHMEELLKEKAGASPWGDSDPAS
jgi:hypothetical protein